MDNDFVIDLIKDLEIFVPCDCELEMDYLYEGDGDDIKEDGWYAMSYCEEDGEALPLFKDMRCIVTQKQIDDNHIDMDYVLTKVGCFVVD